MSRLEMSCDGDDDVDGDSVSFMAGVRHVGPADSFGTEHLPSDVGDDVRRAVARFTEVVESVDLDAPWRTRNAALLDEQTFASWIRSVTSTDAARDHFLRVCDYLFTPDPHETSLLHAAVYFSPGTTPPDCLVVTAPRTSGCTEARPP